MYPVKFVRYGLRGRCRGVENDTTMRHHTSDPSTRQHLDLALYLLISLSPIPLYLSLSLYLLYSISPLFYLSYSPSSVDYPLFFDPTKI